MWLILIEHALNICYGAQNDVIANICKIGQLLMSEFQCKRVRRNVFTNKKTVLQSDTKMDQLGMENCHIGDIPLHNL